jgi:hypothetical protein
MIAFFIGSMFGAICGVSIQAIFSARAYDKGYKDARRR